LVVVFAPPIFSPLGFFLVLARSMPPKATLKLAPRNYELLGPNMDQFVRDGFHTVNPEIIMHGTARGEKPSTVSYDHILAMKGFTYTQEGNFFYVQHFAHPDWVFGTSVGDALRNFVMYFAHDLSMAHAMLHANEMIIQHFRLPEDLVEKFAEREEMEFTVDELLFGQDFDGKDIEPDSMVDCGEKVLMASRIYRTDMGNTVENCSKMAQQAVWGDGDKALKFVDADVTDKVVVAGFGDDTARTHLPFFDAVVDVMDPLYNGRVLSSDTIFEEGESLVSDIADASGFGSEMFAATNHMYTEIHKKYPWLPMNLKLDLYHLPNMGLRMIRKPWPHNFEVICTVDDDADMSWVWPAKSDVIRANWTRNRNIRDGIYTIPEFDRGREQWLRRSARIRHGLKQKTEILVNKREIRRAPISRRDYCNRLRVGDMNVGKEMALGPALFLFAKIHQKDPVLDVIDLDEYELYYSHCTANRAVLAMDTALVKLGLSRNANAVHLPSARREYLRTASFDLLTHMNDHSV